MPTCTEPGYKYCNEDSASGGPITVNTRIYWQFEDVDGNVVEKNGNCYGDLYLKAGMRGNASGATNITNYGPYVFYNVSNFDNIWIPDPCGNSGCSLPGYDLKVNGRVKIASPGETFTKCVIVVGITWATDGDYWAWVGTGRGFEGAGNCSSIQCLYPPGHVMGTVKDASTGNPLENVKVTFFTGSTTYTDSSGYYDLEESVGGSGLITFELSGYVTHDENISAGPGIPNVHLDVDLSVLSTINIRESIGWQATTQYPHPFYLLSFYGTNTDDTPAGFQIKNGNYIRVTTASTSGRNDYVTTPNVLEFDCMTIIAEEFDGSNVRGVYDLKIENSVM